MFSLDEVASAVNGDVVNRKGYLGGTVFVTGVSTDTRTIEEGNLYIALKGEKFDGHDYCEMAVEKNACAVVVDNIRSVPDGAIGIVVKDTLVALGDLARHYRFKLGAKVIAITGSVGKTTTREMVRVALEASMKVTSSQKNYNNEIGLPKAILSAPKGTQVLLLEMGMRALGEIEYLTKIAHPDIAIITNVGYSHIGILGSRENIRTAKTEIIKGLTDQGILIVNGDDNFLFDYVRNIIPLNNGLAAIFASNKVPDKVTNCPLCVNAVNIKENNGMDFDVSMSVNGAVTDKQKMHIGLGGEHNVHNACFAFACAKLVGADMTLAVKALSEYTPMDGRGKTYYGKKYTIINDAYNASPESMAAAFANLDSTNPGSRKIAVLGGMRELGDNAPALHEKTGEACGQYRFDKIIVTGEDKDSFIKGLKSVRSDADITVCADTEEVKKKAHEIIRTGDTVLFKASNAFRFEDLAREFIDNDEDNG